MLNRTKVKIAEIKGKYFSPSLLMLSNSNWDEVSYIASINTCQVPGTKKKLVSLKELAFELNKITIAPKKNMTKKFTNAKLVIEKSKQNNLIENNKIIWNCSKGVYNIIFYNLVLNSSWRYAFLNSTNELGLIASVATK